jgi:hypothetical protein
MNNQLVVKGLEIQTGDLSIKLEELQIGVDMQDGTAAEYMTVLKQLLQLFQGEFEHNRSESTLEEILAN